MKMLPSRTEYWLMYENRKGKVLRWMRFQREATAIEAIGDASETVSAVRWGVKRVDVTEVHGDIKWT